MPFRTMNDEGNPPIELRQVGPRHFKLITGFKYLDPTKDNEAHVVPPHDPGSSDQKTDLASVPWFLWWFIASYGHQTRAALMHDHLVDLMPDRAEADRLFRVALAESEVRFWRRWIMWSAVALETTRRTVFGLFVLLTAQILAGIALVWCALIFSLRGEMSEGPRDIPWLLWLLLPFVASFVWGKRWVIAAVGVYIGALLAPAVVIVGITILISSLPAFMRWIRNGFSLPEGGPIVIPYRRAKF